MDDITIYSPKVYASKGDFLTRLQLPTDFLTISVTNFIIILPDLTRSGDYEKSTFKSKV